MNIAGLIDGPATATAADLATLVEGDLEGCGDVAIRGSRANLARSARRFVSAAFETPTSCSSPLVAAFTFCYCALALGCVVSHVPTVCLAAHALRL